MPSYQVQPGDVGDAIFRQQTIDLGRGNYLLDGGGVALGGSTTSIETEVAPAVLRFGNQVVPADGQTVTHPDGDPDDPRLDTITLDTGGNAGRIAGTPMPANPPENNYPNVRTPAPPVPQSADEVAIAVLAVPAGTGSSSEMFNSAVTERALMGDGLNYLQLVPGRDLQYQFDTAREGEVLRGDRSQTITVDEPLEVTTPNLTIRDINLRFADGAANSDDDDMLTLLADDVSVRNVTINGNRGGLPTVNADGITVKASGCTVQNIRGRNMAGRLVNVNGLDTAAEDNTVENIICRDSRLSAVVVQGNGARRTVVRTVRGLRMGRASLYFFGGSTGTVVSNIYGENQPSAVTLLDGGNAIDAITGTVFDNIRANGTRWVVENATSPTVNHRGFLFQRLTGRNLIHDADVGKGFVDLSNLADVRVNNSFLVGDFNGAHTIFANGASDVSLSNLSLSSDAQNRACVGIFNTPGVTITGIRCANTPGEGIRIQNSAGGFYAPTMITNCDMQNIGKDEIIISTPGTDATMDDILVKNNRADVTTVSLDSAQPIIKDNMP